MMTSSELAPTPPEHERSASVEECAAFLAVTPPEARPRPLVPAMREMFDLSAIEVCEAIWLSHQRRAAG